MPCDAIPRKERFSPLEVGALSGAGLAASPPNDEYPYVDGDGKRLELTEDVDSEASPSPPASFGEDEEEIDLYKLDEEDEGVLGLLV